MIRQASLHAPQVRFMARSAASYGKAVFHKNLTMQNFHKTANLFEFACSFIKVK